MEVKLTLHRLYCHVPEEADFDEAYLKFNGKKIWPREKKYEDVRVGMNTIDVELGAFNGEDRLTVELWEYDTWSRNDHLGNFRVFLDQLGSFTTDLVDRASDKISYSLEYEVG